jgi:vacuolar-type H+-ATPase subunit E/Vma4
LSLSEILETIQTESEATASGLLADAEGEAEQILARARTEAGSEEQRLAGSLEDRIRLERARVLSRSHLDAARARRAAREKVFRRAIEAVTERLGAERFSDSYEELMGSLLDEAMAVMPGATTLQVDPRDVDVMKRVFASRNLDIEIEAEEEPLGGLVLRAPGRTVDNTLATRLSRAEDHLRFVAGEIIPELRGGGSE